MTYQIKHNIFHELPYKKEIILLNFTKFAQNIDIKKPFG